MVITRPSTTALVLDWFKDLVFNSLEINKALCDQVKLTPEDKRITVFNKGKCHGLMISIPNGGHTQPIQIVGAKLEWKNAQKNEKKNITSDKIKSNIPIFNPVWTFLVWWPW